MGDRRYGIQGAAEEKRAIRNAVAHLDSASSLYPAASACQPLRRVVGVEVGSPR